MSAGRNTIYGSAMTLKEDFPEAAAVFAECFTRPAFPRDEFEKVKTLALGAIARRADSPHQEAFELFYDNLPKSSPYHLIQGGKVETIEPLSADDLKAYHAEYFVPNNMLVTVFGDVDPEEAIALVKRHFGGLEPPRDFEAINFRRDNTIPETIVRHKQTGKPTGMVVVGYPGTSMIDKEDYAAMVLLDAIMSGYSYPGGWLHNELRGEGLVYFVHAMLITGPAPGYFGILAQTQPEKIQEVIGRIQRNVAKAASGEITEEEFRTAQQMVIALHAQENTTIGAQAQQAALDELYGLGYAYDKGFDARIEAVRLEDVIRVAKKYFGNYVLVTTSPNAKP
jgi:zinc protease